MLSHYTNYASSNDVKYTVPSLAMIPVHITPAEQPAVLITPSVTCNSISNLKRRVHVTLLKTLFFVSHENKFQVS